MFFFNLLNYFLFLVFIIAMPNNLYASINKQDSDFNSPQFKAHIEDIFVKSYIHNPRKIPRLTMNTLNNNEINLHNFRTKLLIVLFWATWDVASECELQNLSEFFANLDDELLDKFAILAVSLDFKGSASIQQRINELGVKNLLIIHDSDKMLRDSFDVKSLPSSFVAKDGKIILHFSEHLAWSSSVVSSIMVSLIG